MKKNKTYWIIIPIIILILLLSIILLTYKTNNEKEIKEVCIKEKCFSVKIADTPEERATGLMFVNEMKENEGMLFIFDSEKKYSFWMKNTLIPLDIIWISKEMKIVDIQRGNPGNETSLIPKDKALYVLEINPSYNFSIGGDVWLK